jgi:hypothetical protein
MALPDGFIHISEISIPRFSSFNSQQPAIHPRSETFVTVCAAAAEEIKKRIATTSTDLICLTSIRNYKETV